MTLIGPEVDTVLGLIMMVVVVYGRYALYWLRHHGA